MSTKRFKPGQIVNLLRQIEVEIANGKTTPQVMAHSEDILSVVKPEYRNVLPLG